MMDKGRLTDEALCEEASRYVNPCSFPLGGRELSSSTPPSNFGQVVLNEGFFGGLASMVNEEEQTPLRIILADGSNGELVSKGEKSMVGEGAGGSLRGCFRIWRGKDAVRTIAAWRGLVNFWAFLRKVLKVKS